MKIIRTGFLVLAFALGLVEVLSAAVPPPAALVAEELRNVGFEESSASTAAGWKPFVGGYGIDERISHSGRKSLKCVSLGGDAGAGAVQEIAYGNPDRRPVVFGGWCRSEEAVAHPQFYLDLEYDDGTWEWGVHVDWLSSTHEWSRRIRIFEPKKPVRRILAYILLRNGEGIAWFDDMRLTRHDPGFEIFSVARTTERPYRPADYVRIEFGQNLSWRTEGVSEASGKGKVMLVPVSPNDTEITLHLDDGMTNIAATVHVPPSVLEANTLHPDEARVWTADSMRMVTPLTFPPPTALGHVPAVDIELARRERESAQVLVSTGNACELNNVEVHLSPLLSDGVLLKGGMTWNRMGYLVREPGYKVHPLGAASEESWLPDPLLPPRPFKVRKGATQGIWLTVHAAADAKPGRYVGALTLTAAGRLLAKVQVSVRVRDFSLPERFGVATSFSVMDGFTRAMYPKRFAEMRRQSHDLLLDSRLNPDDISRTKPPSVEDVAYWRSRGMSVYNLLNYVPPPSKADQKWVCVSSKEEAFKPELYDHVKGCLAPLVAELRRRDLLDGAYVYGFDEREKDFYKGIERIWKKWRSEFPDVPLMTTAYMYRDLAHGAKESTELFATDWHCPLTSVYDESLAERYRRLGKKVWWYVCCDPTDPYANFASIEYPWADGRMLGWMTYRYRVDGLLYWHVNYWEGKRCLVEDDTYFPSWHTANSLRMPGDGILLYPGKDSIWPSARLAAVRDGVEDCEWLRFASTKCGERPVMELAAMLVTRMHRYERDPMRIRAVRSRLADLIEQAVSSSVGRQALDANNRFIASPGENGQKTQ